MRTDLSLFRSLLLVAAVIAGCSPDRTTAPSARSPHMDGASTNVATLTSTPALVNQAAGLGFTDAKLSSTFPVYMADDFVVPEGAVWSVAQIGLTGFVRFGALTFSFRAHDAGTQSPGAEVPNTAQSVAVSASAPTDFNSDYLFTLPSAIDLQAGRYWLVIRTATANGGAELFWRWHAVAGTSGKWSLDGGATWEVRDHDYTFGLFGATKLAQTITLAPITPNPATIGSTATVTASASSELPVALSAEPFSACTLDGTTLSFVGSGTCTVKASQAGNATYGSAPEVTQKIPVGLIPQSITFPNVSPNPAPVGTSATLGATASSGLEVRYSLSTGSACTLSGNVVSFIAAGPCIVIADQFGNGTYDVAPTQTRTIWVEKLSQTMAFTSTPPAPGYINGRYIAGTSAGASGNPVVLTSVTPNVCILNGSTVTFVAVGTCTVTATQAGNDTYTDAKPVSQTMTVDYRFEGFLDPIKNGTTLNSVKAGQMIALKWRLTDANGAPITALDTPRLTVSELTCSLGVSSGEPTAQAAGTSGLQNLGSGYFQYNWKSPTSYAKSCKTLHVDLGEGSGPRTARFAFSK